MSFKSYVDLNESNNALNSSMDDSHVEHLAPIILPGEMIIAEAHNVLLFTPVTGQSAGKSGLLTVTNFKLSFVTCEEKATEDYYYQENSLLGEYDVCLSNVDSVYLSSSDKKRKLLPGNTAPDKVKRLCVFCKNMRVLNFSFKFSPMGHGKTLTNALLHHAFPRRHQLLFAYDYREPCTKQPVISFRNVEEWKHEMERTGCKGWRVTFSNQRFHMSSTLPELFVVVKDVSDVQINIASQHFRCNRLPLWCWSSKTGAALVRMADTMQTIQDRKQENAMLESVRKTHPRKTPPCVIDLTKDLPSTRELESSYLKLRDLCTPDTVRQFWYQDSHFYSLLENSKWLLYVSNCLQKAIEAANMLDNKVSVVLQEADGRDLCCVLSSLTVLMLDPYFRTLNGFQSLIQKEWVVMGHPFCTRLGHVYKSEEEVQQSPVFLLFLDCVWQLLQQFPTFFEFSETFLTTLWDSAHISIFDTFLFDCDRDRLFAMQEASNPLTPRDVWDWSEMFSVKDMSLFYNPLYEETCSYPLTPSNVQPYVSDLQIWSQCYFRFIPLLEIRDGGKPKIDLAVRALSTEDYSSCIGSMAAENYVGSFFPFTHWHTQTKIQSTSLLANSNLDLNHSDVLNDTHQSGATDSDY